MGDVMCGCEVCGVDYFTGDHHDCAKPSEMSAQQLLEAATIALDWGHGPAMVEYARQVLKLYEEKHLTDGDRRGKATFHRLWTDFRNVNTRWGGRF